MTEYRKPNTEVRKVAVVDLDGTLVRGNTLHIYIKTALAHALRQADLRTAAKIAGWGTLRALRFATHRRMKFALLRAIPAESKMLESFAANVRRQFDPAVVRMIEDWKEQGVTVLLATAAADSYVPYIWDGPFIATPMADNPECRELRGQAKAKAVKAWCKAHGATLHAVVTDHSDDLPLLMAGARHNILVAPTATTRLAAGAAGLDIQVL